MRPATVMVIAVLMLLIVGAAFYQIVIQGPDEAEPAASYFISTLR